MWSAKKKGESDYRWEGIPFYQLREDRRDMAKEKREQLKMQPAPIGQCGEGLLDELGEEGGAQPGFIGAPQAGKRSQLQSTGMT